MLQISQPGFLTLHFGLIRESIVEVTSIELLDFCVLEKADGSVARLFCNKFVLREATN